MSTFDLRTPISAGRMKPLTETSNHSESVEQMIRRNWPDLPPGAPVIMLPREDFEIIVAATEGRPLLQTRPICDFTILPADKPKWYRDAGAGALAMTAWLIFWGAVAIAALAGAFR